MNKRIIIFLSITYFIFYVQIFLIPPGIYGLSPGVGEAACQLSGSLPE